MGRLNMITEIEDDDSFYSFISTSDASIVVFTASWCSPCKQLKEDLQRYGYKLPIAIVDVMKCPLASAEVLVRTVPTIKIINKAKKIVQMIDSKSAIADLKYLGLLV